MWNCKDRHSPSWPPGHSHLKKEISLQSHRLEAKVKVVLLSIFFINIKAEALFPPFYFFHTKIIGIFFHIKVCILFYSGIFIFHVSCFWWCIYFGRMRIFGWSKSSGSCMIVVATKAIFGWSESSSSCMIVVTPPILMSRLQKEYLDGRSHIAVSWSSRLA